MSVTIGAFEFPTLTAQPFGYEEGDTRLGLTARKWSIQGLLTPLEWLDLLTEYDTWRDLRIQDEPTEVSGAVGTTISLTGTGPGGQVWTAIPCWFVTVPQAGQSGAYLAVSVELVDAAQALEVLLRQKEKEEDAAAEDLPDLGTVTLGAAVLKLLKPMETYAQGPQLELTASGVHYISGPLVVQSIRDIEGTTDPAGWAAVLAWYESQIVATPAASAWFPISAPSASAESKIIDGVKTVQYTVSIQLGKVL